MTNQDLTNRFFQLSDALELSKDTDYFTVGQKICIHQERSAVMQANDELESLYNDYTNLPDEVQAINIEPETLPRYIVPRHLNDKIKNLINNPKFQNP